MRSWMMAAVVAVAVAAPALAAEWTTVRDTEAGFTLRLPGEPKVTRGTSGPESGDYPQVQYEMNNGQGWYLVTAVKFGVTLDEAKLTQILDISVGPGPAPRAMSRPPGARSASAGCRAATPSSSTARGAAGCGCSTRTAGCARS